MKAGCARFLSLRTHRRPPLLHLQLQGTHMCSLHLINPQLTLLLYGLELGLLLKPRHYLPVPHRPLCCPRHRPRREKETTKTKPPGRRQRRRLGVAFKPPVLRKPGRLAMVLLPPKRSVPRHFPSIIHSHSLCAVIGGSSFMR